VGGCIGFHRMVDAVAQSLKKYMDVLAARQKLVASNIANVDTPGYKTAPGVPCWVDVDILSAP
jgi:Flagella basal body rod protein